MTAQPVAQRRDLKRELLSIETNTWPRLSPDGRSVVFVRTVDDGPELWLRTRDGRDRQLATHHGEQVADLSWTADGSLLLYRHTRRGREGHQLAALRPAGAGRVAIAAPGPVIEYWLSCSDPAAVVFAARDPSVRRTDLFRATLAQVGEPVLLAVNPGFHRWLVDGDLRPRGGIRLLSDGSTQVVLGDRPDTAVPVLTIDVDAAADLSVQRFSPDGGLLFLLTSGGAATRRLISIECGSGAVETVFEHPTLDVESYPIAGEGVWFDPTTGLPDICTVMDQRLRHHALDERRRSAVAHLVPTADATSVIIDRSADDRTWLTVDVHDDGPIVYHLFDPATGESNPLLVNRPALTGHRLPKLEDFCFTASDGLPVPGYAMRPLHRRPPLPTVVMVHGGPAGRDLWRFHAEAQYLAALGYLSLHVNYRGSRGFGSAFRLAGNGEWGGRMQRDLYEAVTAGVDASLVDPDRVAFFGSSYGGYAALLAACTRPDLVRCAVAISPPCDLVAFTGTPPPYWQPLAVLLRKQVCNPTGGPPLDEAELARRSPAQTLSASCAPLLVAHGARDPRVAVAEVDRFVAAARGAGVANRYLRFPDEGHHVKSNANRETLFNEIEDFLKEHLDAGYSSIAATLHANRPEGALPEGHRPPRT